MSYFMAPLLFSS